MRSKSDQSTMRDLRPTITAPVFPSTSTEFITVMAHYHRAEIARMAAMLSVSLSKPTPHHGVLLFAMVLVLLLLVIEARRYRFFDVYRNRVRRMERNYFAQVFAPEDGGSVANFLFQSFMYSDRSPGGGGWHVQGQAF